MPNIQTANRVTPHSQPSLAIRPQSQHTSRDDAKLAVGKIRHSSTGCNRIQQGATKTRARAYARGNGVPLDFPRHGDCAQAAADSTYRLELPSSSRHADRSNKPNGTF